MKAIMAKSFPGLGAGKEDVGFMGGRPGAGLRRRDRLLLRYVLLPWAAQYQSWDGALRLFQEEGERVLAECAGLSPELLFKRVTVPWLFGIEDGTRHWSAAMVLEHLTTAGTRMGEIIVALSKGRPARPIGDMRELKPSGRVAEDIVEQFGVFLKVFGETMEERVEDRASRRCCEHPRFGSLDAHEWSCVAALHQRLHRRQMQAVRRRLDVWAGKTAGE